ncbi:MAG: PadR family transcriptional regulator [Candidatus Gracilibacteria bacterium]|nr:PadR family transcriptional regulator [Candidatus Gracilibacteria bacterium]
MEKISTQMRKGILEYIILGIISNGDIYGAEIINILKSGDLIVAEGTIYPLLSRLKTDNLINYYWVESESGHPRKYYNLTQEGIDMLILMEKNWLDIKNSIKKILKK